MRNTFFLQHIVREAALLLDLIKGISWEEFGDNIVLVRAAERSFEIIGEAIRNIDPAFKVAHPQIDWQPARAMRNFLAHSYWQVKADVLYQTIQSDIQRLKEDVEHLLAQEL